MLPRRRLLQGASERERQAAPCIFRVICVFTDNTPIIIQLVFIFETGWGEKHTHTQHGWHRRSGEPEKQVLPARRSMGRCGRAAGTRKGGTLQGREQRPVGKERRGHSSGNMAPKSNQFSLSFSPCLRSVGSPCQGARPQPPLSPWTGCLFKGLWETGTWT